MAYGIFEQAAPGCVDRQVGGGRLVICTSSNQIGQSLSVPECFLSSQRNYQPTQRDRIHDRILPTFSSSDSHYLTTQAGLYMIEDLPQRQRDLVVAPKLNDPPRALVFLASARAGIGCLPYGRHGLNKAGADRSRTVPCYPLALGIEKLKNFAAIFLIQLPIECDAF